MNIEDVCNVHVFIQTEKTILINRLTLDVVRKQEDPYGATYSEYRKRSNIDYMAALIRVYECEDGKVSFIVGYSEMNFTTEEYEDFYTSVWIHVELI